MADIKVSALLETLFFFVSVKVSIISLKEYIKNKILNFVKTKLLKGTVPRNELTAVMLMTELAFVDCKTLNGLVNNWLNYCPLMGTQPD